MFKRPLAVLALLVAATSLPAPAAFGAEPPPESTASTFVCSRADAATIAALGGTATHGILCRWNQAASLGFGSYRVARQSAERPMTNAFRTSDLRTLHFLDTHVSPGTRYRYRFGSVQSDGTVNGSLVTATVVA